MTLLLLMSATVSVYCLQGLELMLAVGLGWKPMVCLLLESGANTDLQKTVSLTFSNQTFIHRVSSAVQVELLQSQK